MLASVGARRIAVVGGLTAVTVLAVLLLAGIDTSTESAGRPGARRSVGTTTTMPVESTTTTTTGPAEPPESTAPPLGSNDAEVAELQSRIRKLEQSLSSTTTARPPMSANAAGVAPPSTSSVTTTVADRHSTVTTGPVAVAAPSPQFATTTTAPAATPRPYTYPQLRATDVQRQRWTSSDAAKPVTYTIHNDSEEACTNFGVHFVLYKNGEVVAAKGAGYVADVVERVQVPGRSSIQVTSQVKPFDARSLPPGEYLEIDRATADCRP